MITIHFWIPLFKGFYVSRHLRSSNELEAGDEFLGSVASVESKMKSF
jgi:hypothetical protein